MESLAVRVAAAPVSSITGPWQRHAPAAYPDRVLDGHAAYGRWGTKAGFPVLYLGRPTDSVVVEAYRRLVDPVEDPALLREVRPRILVTCNVRMTNVLDLRGAGARLQVGLTLQDLQSGIDDRAAYAKCQEVAQVAHQLRFHGLVAPAATKLGETLVVFTGIAPADELPRRSGPDVTWDKLPADPRLADPDRRLHVVGDD
jgi:RES domain-containing protein